MDALPLAGLSIGITAERRAEEQAELLRARGAQTLWGPTVRVFSLADDEELRASTAEVVHRPPDYVLASTGFGMRTWLSAAESWDLRSELLEALSHARIANRGAKAASANGAVGLTEWWRAPEERFEEVVDRVLEEPLAGARVVLQLHGMPDPDAVARLEKAGAEVLTVDAYRTSLPLDVDQARVLVEEACARRLAAVTFTTAPAVHNLFAIARGTGRAGELRDAFDGAVVAACVGPVCAEGALEEGITDPLVPKRSRLVPLVHALTERLGQTQV
jgi:uroporphyrinogen-III synthase